MRKGGVMKKITFMISVLTIAAFGICFADDSGMVQAAVGGAVNSKSDQKDIVASTRNMIVGPVVVGSAASAEKGKLATALTGAAKTVSFAAQSAKTQIPETAKSHTIINTPKMSAMKTRFQERFQAKGPTIAGQGLAMTVTKAASKQLSVSEPKFKTNRLTNQFLAASSQQTAAKTIESTSQMGNMQVNYMNKVLEGRVDYLVNEDTKR